MYRGGQDAYTAHISHYGCGCHDGLSRRLLT